MTEALDRLFARLDRVPLTLWWRDDDAGRETRETYAFLERIATIGAPATLAIVPAWLERPLARAIAAMARIDVSQHGWAHENHAAPGAKSIELGGEAARTALRERLARGRSILGEAFGADALELLTPPWNRIAPDVETIAAELGFSWISRFARRSIEREASGLWRLDAHLDPIEWKAGKRWIGLDAMVDRLIALHAKAPAAPVGLLTHHLVMDDAALDDVEALLLGIEAHPRGRVASWRAAAMRV